MEQQKRDEKKNLSFLYSNNKLVNAKGKNVSALIEKFDNIGKNKYQKNINKDEKNSK